MRLFVRWHQFRGHIVDHIGGAYFLGVRCSCGRMRWL
jgi:hypothetical protein